EEPERGDRPAARLGRVVRELVAARALDLAGAGGLPPQPRFGERAQPVAQDAHDARPVDGEDGERRAEVDEHLERDVRLVDAEEVLAEDEVAGRRDREELGEALHEPEDDGFPPGHGARARRSEEGEGRRVRRGSPLRLQAIGPYAGSPGSTSTTSSRSTRTRPGGPPLTGRTYFRSVTITGASGCVRASLKCAASRAAASTTGLGTSAVRLGRR